MHRTPAALIVALSLAAALVGSVTPWAVGAPSAPASSDVTAAEARSANAVERYAEASARLDEVDASVVARTNELDALMAHRADLQAALADRARTMYRNGPLGALDVLVGSATFDQFLTAWDALIRVQRADAAAVRELRASEARLSRTVASLLAEQQNDSRRLRDLRAAKDAARRELLRNRAAYAAFEKAAAAREAARAMGATKVTGGSSAITWGHVVNLYRQVQQPSAGSGSTAPWKTAVASCYGSGSYGVHLASGYTIGPDSMIVAHKTLPFGTLVEFEFGGRRAVATVADRGPFVPGRSFDLGPGTARVLGFEGVGTVRYRVISR